MFEFRRRLYYTLSLMAVERRSGHDDDEESFSKREHVRYRS